MLPSSAWYILTHRMVSLRRMVGFLKVTVILKLSQGSGLGDGVSVALGHPVSDHCWLLQLGGLRKTVGSYSVLRRGEGEPPESWSLTIPRAGDGARPAQQSQPCPHTHLSSLGQRIWLSCLAWLPSALPFILPQDLASSLPNLD